MIMEHLHEDTSFLHEWNAKQQGDSCSSGGPNTQITKNGDPLLKGQTAHTYNAF